MRKLIVAGALALMCTPLMAQASQKLGVVDIRHILENSKVASTVSQKLQTEFMPQQEQLSKNDKVFTKKRNDLEKDAAILSESERQSKERELASLQRDLQLEQMHFSESFNERQQEEMQGFMDSLREVIGSYATSNGFDMVFPSDMSIYFTHSVDITTPILAALDN